MSKKHKHHNNQPTAQNGDTTAPQTEAAPIEKFYDKNPLATSTPVETAPAAEPDVVETEPAEEATPTPAVLPELKAPATPEAAPEESAPIAPAKEETPPAVEKEPAKTEKVPVVEKPVEAAPAKEAALVKPTPNKQEKVVMSEEIFPSRNRIQIAAGIPVQHSPAAARLSKLWDEYDAAVAVNTEDRNELKRRVLKLYQVMSSACPMGEPPATVAADLIRVTFDRFMTNWGKLYDEKTLFKLDYSLPGGAAAIDKLNMFFAAIIQLVEAARTGSPITFNNERLAMIIGNKAIFNAIDKMRQGIERRQRQMNS